jgi:hypothetical protein
MRAILNAFGIVGDGRSSSIEAGPTHSALEPTFEVSCGDETARRVRTDLSLGRWRAAERLLRSPMSDDDRRFYSDAFAEWSGLPKWIAAWTNTRPRSSSAWLIAGAHSINWAWEARGSGYASSVSEEAARLFFARLERAEEALHRAASLNPKDATPWTWLMQSAVGLQLGLEAIEERFERAVALSAEHRRAHSTMLAAVSKKWFGSHDDMFDFARRRSMQAGPGSFIHVLIAEAHVERWLSDRDFQNGSGDAWLQSDEVRNELMAASELTHRGVGVRCGIESIRAANYFAFCFWRGGLHRLAQTQFEATGNWITERPWAYMGDPIAAFERARRECANSEYAQAA